MNRNERSSPVLAAILQAVIGAGFLLFWELSSRADLRNQFMFSRPSLIIPRAWTWMVKGSLWPNAWITLQEAILGFFLGAALGLVLAFVCYGSKTVERVFMPFFEVMNAIPRFVFGPLLMMWFGFGITSKAFLAATMVVFVVFFATYTALRDVDPNLVLKVRLMGGGRWHVVTHVLLPSALSWIFSSLRTGLGFALAGAIVGEYIGASKGLGYQIALSEGNLDSTGVFAGLFWLILLAVVANALLGRVEKWLTRWRVS